jgi:hypothetical protein
LKLSTPYRIVLLSMVVVTLTLFCPGHVLDGVHSGSHLVLFDPEIPGEVEAHSSSMHSSGTQSQVSDPTVMIAIPGMSAMAEMSGVAVMGFMAGNSTRSIYIAYASPVIPAARVDTPDVPMIGGMSDLPMLFGSSIVGLDALLTDAYLQGAPYPIERPTPPSLRSQASPRPEAPPPRRSLVLAPLKGL